MVANGLMGGAGGWRRAAAGGLPGAAAPIWAGGGQWAAGARRIGRARDTRAHKKTRRVAGFGSIRFGLVRRVLGVNERPEYRHGRHVYLQGPFGQCDEMPSSIVVGVNSAKLH